MAAATITLESAWRPPKLLVSLCGGRRIDSVYAETTLAQGRITSHHQRRKGMSRKLSQALIEALVTVKNPMPLEVILVLIKRSKR
ncbi:hypothetical protein PoB_007112200 [Plakobranchus ocellatus]|uniref:N-acetyltransferase domain-containing protein n=1 Tax=Plakobranchus ocellatus TaxID=259542 RepID=A0AAV4DKP6_9GAST|nr:hypothetical protein PoB_007112200 [Plakobranchus ocellatus]